MDGNKTCDEGELPFDLLTLALRLGTRWKTMLLVAALATVAGVLLASLFGSRVYQAEVVLHYRPSQAESKPPNLLTLLNMVKLQENLREVRERLQLDMSLESLAGAYKVDVQRDTELLIIRACSDSPEQALTLATSLRDVFLERQEQKRRLKLKANQSDLEERLETVSAELRQAEAELTAFTVKHRIVDLDKEAQWYLEELTNLQIMLEQAQVQRTSVRQKSDNIDRIVSDLRYKVESEKSASTTQFDSLGDVNIRVQRLRAAIHDDKTQRSGEALLAQKKLELERAEKLRAEGLISAAEYEKALAAYESQQALTVDTPQVAEWKEKVDQLNDIAIPNSSAVTQSGPILQEMMLKAFDIELEQVTQDKRVASIEEAVQRARRRLDALPELQRRYATLSREIESAEVQKKDLEERLGDTRRMLSTRLLDFVVASEAHPPSAPISSNRRMLALAVTVVLVGLGLLILLAFELLDPSCRSLPELRARSGLEVLGGLPDEGGAGAGPCRADNLLARKLPTRACLMMSPVDEVTPAAEVAGRLGRALAFQGLSTVLVGLPSERPGHSLGRFFYGLDPQVNPVAGETAGLDLIFQGDQPLTPAHYRGEPMAGLLRRLRNDYDVVLVLTPSLQNSVVGDVAAELADGVVLLHHDSSRVTHLTQAAARLAGADLLGVVMSGVRKPYAELAA